MNAVDRLLELIAGSPELFRQHPWLLVLALVAPLVPLAAVWRIFPHVPLVILLVVPGLLSFSVLFWPDEFWMVLLADLVLVAVGAADLWTLPGKRAVSAERQLVRTASLGQKHRVTLAVTNHSARPLVLWVRDDVPQSFDVEPPQLVLQLEPRRRVVTHYHMTASRRGAFRMERIYLRLRSRLGLWQAMRRVEQLSLVHVYPDMKQLSEYAVLARKNRLSLMGLRRSRKIGQDNEFERLRDYTRDDNYRHIDWRSTARRNKLTVKDFQTNQSQRIVFLVDCGRMMTNIASGLSLLDHALNAMLMMSYVALRQGDAVGLICFSDRIHSYVAPRGGMKQMNHLLHAAFDQFPQLVESRYDQAFLYLRNRLAKRALVVLVTNIIDEVNSQQVQQYLSSLAGRHLPLGVLLRDRSLFHAADQTAVEGPALYRAAAAAQILTWRHQVLVDLQHQGVLTIDTFPEQLTAPLVNRYLEIKARHLL